MYVQHMNVCMHECMHVCVCVCTYAWPLSSRGGLALAGSAPARRRAPMAPSTEFVWELCHASHVAFESGGGGGGGVRWGGVTRKHTQRELYSLHIVREIRTTI